MKHSFKVGDFVEVLKDSTNNSSHPKYDIRIFHKGGYQGYITAIEPKYEYIGSDGIELDGNMYTGANCIKLIQSGGDYSIF